MSASMEVYYERARRDREQWARQLVELGDTVTRLGEAMAEEDSILGPLVSETLITQLAGLPAHLRELLAEHVSDEAARGLRADRLYVESRGAA